MNAIYRVHAYFLKLCNFEDQLYKIHSNQQSYCQIWRRNNCVTRGIFTYFLVNAKWILVVLCLLDAFLKSPPLTFPKSKKTQQKHNLYSQQFEFEFRKNNVHFWLLIRIFLKPVTSLPLSSLSKKMSNLCHPPLRKRNFIY